ncbi:MAG: DUF1045 domain-containing protein [Pseudomonadota bacterium]|jgi:hypothetical protein|nr:DUF1045 domain-containing protein [Pseudomonadota bacterium]
MSECDLNALEAMGAYRWAVYFSPAPHSPWARAGARWLGRDVDGEACGPPPRIAGWSVPAWSRVTAAPRRYGWHGTLRAPWRLAQQFDPAELLLALKRIAEEFAPFDLPRLHLGELGGFLALQLVQPCAALQALADACVVRLQPMAAPLTAAERDRYAARGLSAGQQALLHEWGYPYVREEFCFHMTLTDRLDGLSSPQRAELRAAAAASFETLPQPLHFDALSLFAEPQPGAALRRVARIALNGGAGREA